MNGEQNCNMDESSDPGLPPIPPLKTKVSPDRHPENLTLYFRPPPSPKKKGFGFLYSPTLCPFLEILTFSFADFGVRGTP